MDTAVKFYLFELGYSIVKVDDTGWFKRDRENHLWIRQMDWMLRYYDAQYDVISITYDESREKITDRHPIEGFSSIEINKLLAFENNGM